MPVHTFGAIDFNQPNTGSPFPTLNGDLTVLARTAAAFAPHETAPPSMAVAVDAGALFASGTLTEIAAQATPAITPPAANPRIDRITLNRITGAISVVTGTEAANPVPPAIPAGQSPLAQVRLEPGIGAISNAVIKDERVSVAGAGGGLIGVQRFATSGTYTPTLGTRTVLVEVQGGGGSGGACPATGSGQATASAGGAAGAYGRSIYTVDFASIAITVGVGGAQPAAGSNNGISGASSSFGTS